MKRILLIALGLMSMQFAFAQFGQRTPTPNDTLKSVRVNPDGSVTFSIYAPNANSVSLTGDVWGPGPFQKAENGVWSATIPQMNAGAVRYAFNVDGLQVFDPKFSRLGEIRPVLKLDKGEDQFWTQKDVPHGAISVIYYKSSTTGTTRRMHVWTPAGYVAKGKKLPVFYLIHGGGDNDASWPGVGCAGDILDNLMAEGKMKPMIVVMPDGSMDTDKFVDDLNNDIMPYMAKNYRIKKGAKNTALAGLSMGGLETLNCFLAHPDTFGYINVMSSGWFKGNEEMYAKGGARLKEIASTLTKKCKLLIFTMGGKEDIAYENCQEMLKCFDEVAIPYEYSEMPGGHSWHVWRHDLYHFAQRIFK
ncbi:MAG: endo-1,4-beta-xylanase Z [Bacteroidales bacterium]|nr:endo-1,4-beta-xylanase Z [Bacteroidales bacterium]